jgi:hypothetical protein
MRLPNTITIAGVEYERDRDYDGTLRDVWIADHDRRSCITRNKDKLWCHKGPLTPLPIGVYWNGPWMSTPEEAFRAACEATLRELSDEYTRKRDGILKALVALDKGE